MALDVGTRRIADGGVQSVSLNRAVGGYEMVFPLKFTVSPGQDGLPRASLLGARVTARANESEPQPLGFARPEQPADVVCRPHVSLATPTFHLYLQPAHLAALETLRASGDLTFELRLSGTAADHNGEQYVHGACTAVVPRSTWLETLRRAGARNVLLLEVPLPLDTVSDQPPELAADLHRAEQRYRDGDYHGCISSCRTAVEHAARGIYGDQALADALDALASRRTRMTKPERGAAVYAALRHYTHQAHHAPDDGGVSGYTRSEAEFVLTLAATALAHAVHT